MTLRLFIDDIREPRHAGFKDDEWFCARNFNDAIIFILENKPQRIAFDHDLADIHYSGQEYQGEEKTGYDIAKWLVDLDMSDPNGEYITKDFDFSCHSMNPVGKRNILNLLSRYKLEKFSV